MKRLTRFLATLIACIAASFAVSLLAVHAFWIGVKISHSVPFARTADSIGSLALMPGRVALLVLDAMLGTSTVLPEPRILAAINSVIVGLCLYGLLQGFRRAPGSPRF